MKNKRRLIAVSVFVALISASLISVLTILPGRELPDENETKLAQELTSKIKTFAQDFEVKEVFYEAKKNVITINTYGYENYDPKLCLLIPKVVPAEKIACKRLVINCFDKRVMSSEQKGKIIFSEKIATDPVLTIEISKGVEKCRSSK